MNKKQFDEWEKATTNFDFDEKLIRMQMKRSKIKHVSIRFLQSFITVFALLFILSNTSQSFVNATRNIPILNKLTEALNINESIKFAMENDYIQVFDQTVEEDDLKVVVDSMLVDEKSIYVFYNVYSNDEKLNPADYIVSASLPNEDDGSLSLQSPSDDYDMIEYVFIDGTDISTYSSFYMDVQHRGQILHVELPIDTSKIAKKKEVKVNQTIDIEDQKLTIEKIEIYPLSLRIYVQEDENNRYMLAHPKFTLIINGEKVERFGLLALNDVYFIDTPYFISDDFEIILESVELIEKPGIVTFDIESETLYGSTESVELVEAGYDEYGGLDIIIKNKTTPREDTDQLLLSEDHCTATYWMTHYPKEEKIVYNQFHFSKETVENTDQLTFTLNIGKTVEIDEKLKVK